MQFGVLKYMHITMMCDYAFYNGRIKTDTKIITQVEKAMCTPGVSCLHVYVRRSNATWAYTVPTHMYSDLQTSSLLELFKPKISPIFLATQDQNLH